MNVAHEITGQALNSGDAEGAKTLATKGDVQDLRKEISDTRLMVSDTKAEILRWMFIFWLGLIPVIAGLLKLVK